MALLIPTGFAQATIPFSHVGTPRESVVTFGVNSAGAGGNFVALADAIFDAWNASIGSLMDAEVLMGPVELRVGQDGGDALAVSGTHIANGGTVQSAAPSNVAVLIQKRSTRGGRRGRGRMYVPWLISDANVNEVGIIVAGTVTAIQTECIDFLAGLTAASTGMVLLHNTGGSAPGSPDVVNALIVDNLIGTQRRRLGR